MFLKSALIDKLAPVITGYKFFIKVMTNPISENLIITQDGSWFAILTFLNLNP